MDSKKEIVNEILVKITDMEKKANSFLVIASALREFFEGENRKEQEALVEMFSTYMSDQKKKLTEIFLIIDNFENR